MTNIEMVDRMSDEEMNDFSQIIANTISNICIFSDKYNYDRDNIFKHLTQTMNTMAEISTINNFQIDNDII